MKINYNVREPHKISYRSKWCMFVRVCNLQSNSYAFTRSHVAFVSKCYKKIAIESIIRVYTQNTRFMHCLNIWICQQYATWNACLDLTGKNTSRIILFFSYHHEKSYNKLPDFKRIGQRSCFGWSNIKALKMIWKKNVIEHSIKCWIWKLTF